MQEISHLVWDEKYRFKDRAGNSLEETPDDTHRRVVRGAYKGDPDIEAAKRAERAMLEWRWNPAGRIHAGAGTDKRVTWINCFVLPIIADSMDTHEKSGALGIMDCLKVAALTQQMGGGIGMDFSTLRPKGAIVVRTQSVSDGPLVFMEMWDSMCSTIMSAGWRRGAMMATLRVDHPDIEGFILAKQTAGVLTNFNVSVTVTNAFMEAVKEDLDWELVFDVPRENPLTLPKPETALYVYKTLKARDLWEKILRSTYVHAEPGVIFIDRVNELNNLNYCETITATNPCGEQPLPPNGDCDLGAVNLAVLVKDPFTGEAKVDWEGLEDTVRVGVRFLDNVLDRTLYPTEDQKKEALSKRRIGLGVTGLGNMLQQLTLRYGSRAAIAQVGEVMQFIRDKAYWTSIGLAEERGSFPLYNEKEFLKSPFIRALPRLIKSAIKKKGIRNGLLLTIAPTGTTSCYYHNISSGMEPSFSWQYTRKKRAPEGGYTSVEVEDYGYLKFREMFGDDEPLPDYMVTALELTVDEHLMMQATCQKFVDAAISKTMNVPTEMSFEDFRQVYQNAWDWGCKGCTTYREDPNSVRGSILTVGKEVLPTIEPTPRPEVLEGKTYKLKWPETETAFYVTFNYYVRADGTKAPFEMFISSKNVQHAEWMTVLTRVVSAVFRRGGDTAFLVDELKQIYSPLGGAWVNQKYVPSLVALFGETLERFLADIGPDGLPQTEEEGSLSPLMLATRTGRLGEFCPRCSQPALVRKEGCNTCENCGWSNCG